MVRIFALKHLDHWFMEQIYDLKIYIPPQISQFRRAIAKRLSLLHGGLKPVAV